MQLRLTESPANLPNYSREKKTSVTAAQKVLETPDDHIMPVGLPNMFTQIKIVSRQSGDPVEGPDYQGEICVKSPQTFIGYLGENNNRVRLSNFLMLERALILSKLP